MMPETGDLYPECLRGDGRLLFRMTLVDACILIHRNQRMQEYG